MNIIDPITVVFVDVVTNVDYARFLGEDLRRGDFGADIADILIGVGQGDPVPLQFAEIERIARLDLEQSAQFVGGQDAVPLKEEIADFILHPFVDDEFHRNPGVLPTESAEPFPLLKLTVDSGVEITEIPVIFEQLVDVLVESFAAEITAD